MSFEDYNQRVTLIATHRLERVYRPGERLQYPWNPPFPAQYSARDQEIARAERLADERRNFYRYDLTFVEHMALFDYMMCARKLDVARQGFANNSLTGAQRTAHEDVVYELEPKANALLRQWHVESKNAVGYSSFFHICSRAPFWCPHEHAAHKYEWLRIFETDPQVPDDTLEFWFTQANFFYDDVVLEMGRLTNNIPAETTQGVECARMFKKLESFLEQDASGKETQQLCVKMLDQLELSLEWCRSLGATG